MGEVRQWILKVHDNGTFIQVWKGPEIDGPTEVIAKADLQPLVDKLKHQNFEIYEEVQEFLNAWESK